jgi:hypothetical protein
MIHRALYLFVFLAVSMQSACDHLPQAAQPGGSNAAGGKAAAVSSERQSSMPAEDRIRICEQYPMHWQYKGQPVLLLGGSVEDNLFQISNLAEHLDTLAEAGGNYVRCTLSSRDEGNVWPFEKNEGGLYDLNQPSQAFWSRFRNFCEETARRDVIVQLEVWATFDYYRSHWQDNPFNPKNNVNYTAEEIGLPTEVTTHPTKTDNPFFFSVPKADNNVELLKYQQAFVDKLLSISLDYGHLLYCMDNETSVTPEWGWYWARYIRDKARAAGCTVELTEMWDAHDLSDKQHTYTIDHPDIFTFVDVSQNNHQKGQTHWDKAQALRQRISDPVRPLNNVKVYGADGGKHGNTTNGLQRFWRNVMGKMASVRFHRPTAGLGLGELARKHLKSARMLTDAIDVFQAQPHNDLLLGRKPNHAYCLARSDREAIVVFFDTMVIGFDASAMPPGRKLRWLDISQAKWLDWQDAPDKDHIALDPPGEGYQAVLITTEP